MLIGLLTLSLISYAQINQEITINGDSVKLSAIPLEEIPIISLESEVKLEKLTESLISKDELSEEKIRLDSILSNIDKILVVESKINYDSLLSRNLVNKNNFLSEQKEILEKQVERIQGIISDLSSKSKEANQELQIWLNTFSLLDSTFSDSLYANVINQSILHTDSVRKVIIQRIETSFTMLKEVKKYDARVENLLIEIKSIIRSRQELIFEKTHPAMLLVNFKEHSHWNLSERVNSFIDENIDILSLFFRNNVNRLFLFISFLILLIGVFFFLNLRIDRMGLSRDSVYQSSIIKILHRPVSLAIILGIFSSGLFFPNQPPILIDINILIITIPIIDVVHHVSNKKGKIYLATFALLILLRFVNYIFPPVTLIHRFILIMMGGLEIVVLISLFRNLNIKRFTNHTFNQLVRIIILFHLLASISGLIANLTGHLRLAEIAIDLSITNTLVGLLLIISTVVVIGLLHLVIDGKHLKEIRFLQNRSQIIKNRITVIILLAGALLWINYILEILRINDIFYQSVYSMLNSKIFLGSASFTMGSVILFFFIIWLSVIVSDMIRAVLEDDVLHRVSLKKGVPRMISVVVRFSLISIGIFLAVSAIGMPLNQLTIIFSAFSVGIGFGLQNVVNNFVSGIILLFERPVQIGDAVEVGNLIGTVKSMGIRSSNVRTFDGAEVIVPNANLISNEVINWTLSDKKRRIEIISGVAYGSDVHHVKEILLGILINHPDILQNPKPLVLFNDLGESSLDFRMLFWTENYDNWIIIKSEIIFKIHDALKEAGIKIPFPQRDLHIKSKDLD